MRTITTRRTILGLATAALMMLMMLALQPRIAHADNGEQALASVPQDTVILMNFDVERLRSSPLYASAMQAMTSDPEVKAVLDKLKADAGFDVTTDLNGLLVALPSGFEASQSALMIARGSFDEAKIVTAAEASGGQFTKAEHSGQAIYRIEGGMAVAFMGSTAIFGNEALVKQAIDASKGGTSVRANAQMTGLLGDVDMDKDMWMAFVVPDALKRAQPMMATLNTVRASLDISAGLGLRLAIGAADANTAQQFATMIQGQLPQVASQPMVKSMGFDTAINKVRVTNSGNDIKLELDLTEAEFAALQENLKNLLGSMR